MDKKIKFEPDWVVHPGVIIEDFLEDYDYSKDDLSAKTNWSKEYVDDLLNGEITINNEIAKKLCLILGMDKQFWLNIQHNYERHAERIRKAELKKARRPHPHHELKLVTAKI
jgi:addiction module HigA family antidote